MSRLHKILGSLSIGVVAISVALGTGVRAGTHDGVQRAIAAADLVVVGRVIDVHAEYGVQSDWTGNDAAEDADRPLPLTVVTLEVRGVRKGWWKKDVITFVAPWGTPPGTQPMGLNHPLTIVEGWSYDYKVGQIILVPLWWHPGLRGGAFRTTGDAARFTLTDGEWVSPAAGGGAVMTSTEMQRLLRRAVGPVRIERVAADSKLVVRGRILNVQREDKGVFSTKIDYVTMRVDSVLNGSYSDAEVEFRIGRRVRADTAWYAYSPNLSAKQEWIVCLGADSAGFFPLRGGNGMFRVSGQRLYRGEGLLIPQRVPDIVRIVEKVGKR